MYPGTVYIAKHVGIDLPLIRQQGASVHEVDGSLRHMCQIDKDIALELFEYATEHAWPLAWFDHTNYLVTERTQQSDFFAAVSHVEPVVDAAPHQSGIQATGIDIISNQEESTRVHKFLEARYGSRITLLDFMTVTAVHAPDASKGNALSILADDLGVAQNNVLAISDSVNDVSMLSWAGQSAAPAHSDAYAAEAAKEMLMGEDVDGVVNKLLSLV